MIPDLNFELMMGTLGGKFTTLEGLLTDIKEQLMRPYSMMRGQDSAQEGSGTKLKEFIDKLDEVKNWASGCGNQPGDSWVLVGWGFQKRNSSTRLVI